MKNSFFGLFQSDNSGHTSDSSSNSKDNLRLAATSDLLQITREIDTNQNSKFSSDKSSNRTVDGSVCDDGSLQGTGDSGVDSSIAPVLLPYRERQFEEIMKSSVIDIDKLKQLTWNGVPPHLRGDIWRLLLGYLPLNSSRREATISRKRSEYNTLVSQTFNIQEYERSASEQKTLRQILVDLPRTTTGSTIDDKSYILHQPKVQSCLERILYIFSLRHPATGYVQGMNDLVFPIFLSLLSLHKHDTDVGLLSDDEFNCIESDCYWSFDKFIAPVQDNFIFGHPGIQRSILRLSDLIRRLDNELFLHLERLDIRISDFAFRWMNCLLTREFPINITMRIWDTYLSCAGDSLMSFHSNVCAVLVSKFSPRLLRMGTQEELLMFLQDLPTANWTYADIEPVLSQAFILSTLFDGAPSHLV